VVGPPKRIHINRKKNPTLVRLSPAAAHSKVVLQCVAVCCSALQCVAVCCSVLQCVAVCSSVFQCVAVCCNVRLSPAARSCCSVLQCVAVCCSMLQCVAVCSSVLQCVAVCCSVLQCAALSSSKVTDHRNPCCLRTSSWHTHTHITATHCHSNCCPLKPLLS